MTDQPQDALAGAWEEGVRASFLSEAHTLTDVLRSNPYRRLSGDAEQSKQPTPDPADDHAALGEYPPIAHCLFTGGDHLLNDLGVCVRCDTAPPPPPLDIRDAPASYTTEPPQ